MNIKSIASEILRVAASQNPKSIDDLDPAEQKVARKMMDKGYKVVAQVTTSGSGGEKDFGDPLYFKSADEVGPFLRSFPSYQKAKTRWNFAL